MNRKICFLILTLITIFCALTITISADTEQTPTAIEIPIADNTVFTYNGEEQTYTIAESEYYDVVGNKEKHAGTYTVSVNLKDTEKYVWSDGTINAKTYEFVINKAVCDPEDIIFKDKLAKCDGMVHSIYAKCPEGITPVYTGNGQVNPGIYTVTVSFETTDYEPIPPRTATLTVNRASLRVDNDNPTNDGVLLWQTNNVGFAPDMKIAVTESEIDSEGFADGEESYFVKSYVLKVLKGNEETSLEGKIKIQIPIPEYLEDIDFRLVTKADGEIRDVRFTRFNRHVIFETYELSEFAFVYEEKPMAALIVTLVVINALLIGVLVLLLYVNKKNRTLYAFSPVMFGKAVSEFDYNVLIVLFIIGGVLLIFDVILLIKYLHERKYRGIKEIIINPKSMQSQDAQNVKTEPENICAPENEEPLISSSVENKCNNTQYEATEDNSNNLQ